VPTVPSASDEVVIDGATGAGEITMLRALVLSPAVLDALTVKLEVPVVVGVPLIVAPDKVNPAGKLPLTILHVIGPVPVAANVSEYAEPTVPPASDAVVMTGATAAEVMVIDSAFVSAPIPLSALTVKLNVPITVGVPLITPVTDKVNPPGKAPLIKLQLIV